RLPPRRASCAVADDRLPALGESDRVEHAAAVLAGEKSVRSRHGIGQRLRALSYGAMRSKRREVDPRGPERLARRPCPLIGRLDQHEGVAQRLVARGGRGYQLKGVLLWKRVGPRHHEVVADLSGGMSAPELRVRDRERLDRLRVLSAKQRE